MLKIRLTRTGKKKQPNYRVVVANKDAKRDGRIVERIGHYNPLVDPAEYRIQEDRALYWLSVGAQPTDAVRRLLEKQGTLGRLQRFHAGEPLETLVAEYTGVSAPAKTETAVAEKQAAAVAEETIEETEAEDVAAAVVEEVVADAAEEETVAEVAEEVDVEAAAEETEVEEEAVAEIVIEEAAAAEAAAAEEVAETAVETAADTIEEAEEDTAANEDAGSEPEEA